MDNKIQKTTRNPLTWFDEFWNRDWLQPFPKGQEYHPTIPAVNIFETENEFRVEMAVPGKQKEDFKVSVENNVLVISSEEKVETSEKGDDGRFTRREFSYSSFSRAFNLPESVEEEKISAGYENGMLLVELPKKKPTNVETSRQIKIK